MGGKKINPRQQRKPRGYHTRDLIPSKGESHQGKREKRQGNPKKQQWDREDS